MLANQFILLDSFVFISMIFMHIFDDFRQPDFLAKYKQKINWQKDEIGNKELYRNDYKACLFIHSLMWSISIHIPIFVFILKIFSDTGFQTLSNMYLLVVLSFTVIWLIIDALCHYCIDDMKANKYCINLIIDQFLHLVQIIITFVAWTFLLYHISC